MKKRIIAAAAAAAASLFALTAFAGEEKLSIGEKKTDYDYEITLVNETGKDIREAFLRISYGEFSENLISDGAVFEKDAQAVLYCTPADMVNYIPPVYDLKLVFEDDSEAVLHTLPFGDANEISIVRDTAEEEKESEEEGEDEGTDTVYARFTSLSLNYETDTKRREGEIAQIGEQVLIADYEAKVAGGGYSGGGGDGGYSGGGGGGGTQDSCLGDGLMY